MSLSLFSSNRSFWAAGEVRHAFKLGVRLTRNMLCLSEIPKWPEREGTSLPKGGSRWKQQAVGPGLTSFPLAVLVTGPHTVGPQNLGIVLAERLLKAPPAGPCAQHFTHSLMSSQPRGRGGRIGYLFDWEFREHQLRPYYVPDLELGFEDAKNSVLGLSVQEGDNLSQQTNNRVMTSGRE